MLTFLVTAGGGLIDSNTVEALSRQGEKDQVLDAFSIGRRVSLVVVHQLTQPLDRLEIIEGDLRSHDAVRDAARRVDYILHQGALPSVPRSVHAPLTINEVNVVGELNVLQDARETGGEHLVYATSECGQIDQF